MTNYERIKSMSVSELAEMLMENGIECRCCVHYNKLSCYDCDDEIAKDGIMQWLISEVKE